MKKLPIKDYHQNGLKKLINKQLNIYPLHKSMAFSINF